MAAPSPADRLLALLAAKIAEEARLDPALAREVAPSALAADSVDESEPIALRDARGHVVAHVPFALVEEAFDDLDDEEDGER